MYVMGVTVYALVPSLSLSFKQITCLVFSMTQGYQSGCAVDQIIQILKSTTHSTAAYLSSVEAIMRRQRLNTALWVSPRSLPTTSGWLASRNGPNKISTCGGLSRTVVKKSVSGS